MSYVNYLEVNRTIAAKATQLDVMDEECSLKVLIKFNSTTFANNIW